MKTSIRVPGQNFIYQVDGRGDPKELLNWLPKNRVTIEDALIQNGAVLLRGFNLTPEDFRMAANAVSNQEVPYMNGATPRKLHIDGVYLASDFPKSLILPQHHEMSYMSVWPMKVFFYCDIPAAQGGETPICSTRTFMKKISKTVLDKVSRLGIKYLRNYDGGIVTDWKQAFMTNDPREVERICRETGLQAEWRDNGARLRTWGHAQGTARHPMTGEMLWHNHALNFTFRSDNPAAMTPILRMSAPALPPEQLSKWRTIDHLDLPMNTYYGDGSLIEQSVLDEVAGLLEAEKIAFPWQKGDMVILDNMLASHGRNPFEGERRILSILKEPSDLTESLIQRAA